MSVVIELYNLFMWRWHNSRIPTRFHQQYALIILLLHFSTSGKWTMWRTQAQHVIARTPFVLVCAMRRFIWRVLELAPCFEKCSYEHRQAEEKWSIVKSRYKGEFILVSVCIGRHKLILFQLAQRCRPTSADAQRRYNQIYNWTNMSWYCTVHFLDARALLLTERVIVLCVYAAHACSFNYESVYSMDAPWDEAVVELTILWSESTYIVVNGSDLSSYDNLDYSHEGVVIQTRFRRLTRVNQCSRWLLVYGGD